MMIYTKNTFENHSNSLKMQNLCKCSLLLARTSYESYWSLGRKVHSLCSLGFDSRYVINSYNSIILLTTVFPTPMYLLSSWKENKKTTQGMSQFTLKNFL